MAQTTNVFQAEVLDDLGQITSSVRDIGGVVAIIHQGGGLKAGIVLQDAKKMGLLPHYDGVPADEACISALPVPDSGLSHWIEIPAGMLSMSLMPPGEAQPLLYLVLCGDGNLALPIAGRRNNGVLEWSGNGDIIDYLSHLLADVGVLKRQRASADKGGSL